MGSAVGELTGSNRRAARAAGRAARAQERAARAQQERAIAAAESPQELAALRQGLQVQERSLARQERLIEAIDPVTLEAAGQALQLLQGQEAKALQPIRQQRQRQRQRLLDSLREQLGPGAETSSAGIQALQNFDFQTSQALAGAQQQSLGQIFGIAQSGQDNRLAQQAAGFAGLAGGFGNIASRRVNAITGTGAGVVGSAGSRFVQSQLRAQQQQAIGSEAFQAAVAGGTAALTGGIPLGNIFSGGGGQSNFNATDAAIAGGVAFGPPKPSFG